MNGGVMFLYSIALLYLNRRRLPLEIRIGPLRTLMMCWSVLFFGTFTVWALWSAIANMLR